MPLERKRNSGRSKGRSEIQPKRNGSAREGAAMAMVIFGNHSSVIVPYQDRDDIRKFYCGVLGAKITKEESDRDFLLLGEDFYIVFLYGDVC
jgi:hypothetical protein